MEQPLAETPLSAWHREHDGRMVDFAGWSMPVQYGSITAEHLATRTRAALFDVSHMGRLRISGAAAGGWLDQILTRSVRMLAPGRIRYSLVTQDDGGILDDVLAYRLPESAHGTADDWLLVVNASNRATIWNWLHQHGPPADVTLVDQTQSTAMIAVQGPLAIDLVVAALGLVDIGSLANYGVAEPRVDGHDWIVSRTGYTGEDGVELILPAEVALDVWTRLLASGAAQGVIAAGLGARDTLRLEAAMPLYGHELSTSILPWQAGLRFAVNLAERTFPGRDRLAATEDQATPCRIGLRLEGKRVAREHAVVSAQDGCVVGSVTSGTFSPTLQQSIAMAYVDQDASAIGTRLLVDVRGKSEPAEVVALPFYQRPKR